MFSVPKYCQSLERLQRNAHDCRFATYTKRDRLFIIKRVQSLQTPSRTDYKDMISAGATLTTDQIQSTFNPTTTTTMKTKSFCLLLREFCRQIELTKDMSSTKETLTTDQYTVNF